MACHSRRRTLMRLLRRHLKPDAFHAPTVDLDGISPDGPQGVPVGIGETSDVGFAHRLGINVSDLDGDTPEPEAIDLLPFGTVRYMEWTDPSNDKRPQSEAAWSRQLEKIAALSEASDTTPWLTIPHDIDLDTFQFVCSALGDAFADSSRVWLEIGGNERWNKSFPAQRYLIDKYDVSTSGGWPNQRELGRAAGIESKTQFAPIVRAHSNARIVQGCNTNNPDFARGILEEFADFDMLAASGYLPVPRDGQAQDDAAQLIALARAQQERRMGNVREHVQIAKDAGKLLGLYEWGPSITPYKLSNVSYATGQAAAEHPDMEALIANLGIELAKHIDGPMCFYAWGPADDTWSLCGNPTKLQGIQKVREYINANA